MSEQWFTASEGAAALGMSDKTFAAYARALQIEPIISLNDRRKKLFSESQIRQIEQGWPALHAKMRLGVREPGEGRVHHTDVGERLAALEARVAKLEEENIALQRVVRRLLKE